jgi:hypothetical protein
MLAWRTAAIFSMSSYRTPEWPRIKEWRRMRIAPRTHDSGMLVEARLPCAAAAAVATRRSVVVVVGRHWSLWSVEVGGRRCRLARSVVVVVGRRCQSARLAWTKSRRISRQDTEGGRCTHSLEGQTPGLVSMWKCRHRHVLVCPEPIVVCMAFRAERD